MYTRDALWWEGGEGQYCFSSWLAGARIVVVVGMKEKSTLYDEDYVLPSLYVSGTGEGQDLQTRGCSS